MVMFTAVMAIWIKHESQYAVQSYKSTASLLDIKSKHILGKLLFFDYQIKECLLLPNQTRSSKCSEGEKQAY